MPAKFRDKSDTYDVTFTDGHVAVGLVVLKTDKFKAETKRFVDFLLSPEGRAIWKANGYEIEPVAPTTQPTTKP